MGASQNEINNSGIMQGTTQGNHNIVLNIFVLGQGELASGTDLVDYEDLLQQGKAFQGEFADQILAQLQRVAGGQGTKAAIDYTVPVAPLLEPPLLVEHHSRREETVRTFRQLVARHTWIALYGGASAGKTLLTLLLAQEYATGYTWIRLRANRTYEQAHIQFDRACQALMGEPLRSHQYTRYERLAEQLGEHGLLVLDDIPHLSGDDALSERLFQLIRACQSKDTKVVSTSPYVLPHQFTDTFGPQVLAEWLCPPFTDAETSELLQSYGAPSSVLIYGSMISSLTGGHPLLIASTAKYLREQHWHVNETTLANLFSNRHTNDINEETLHRLLETVEDAQNRELLYRLNLIRGTFCLNDVLNVAAVVPPVDQPRTRLRPLAGLWVKRVPQDEYLISPLIRTLGSDDIPVQTRKACNLALGESLLQKETLDLFDVQNAWHYFVQAQEYNRAGQILIKVLLDMNVRPTDVPDLGVLSIWAGEPLPSQMNLGTRLYLRGLQVAVRHKRALDTSYLVQDLLELMRQVTVNEAWAILAVWTVTRDILPKMQFPLLNVLRFLPHAQLPTGEPLTDAFEDLHPESLIWVCVPDIETRDELNEWISAVEQLSTEQRRYAFGEKYAELGCMIVANRLWLNETRIPREQQQWESVLGALHDLAERASRIHLDLLWACAVRAQVMVLAEYCRDLTTAVASAEAALAKPLDDPRVQFLLRECVGRQYLYAHENGKALKWLRQALDLPTDAYPSTHMLALLHASQAIGVDDPPVALDYAQRAVHLGNTAIESDIGDTDMVKALGELAIAEWLSDNRLAAFHAMDQAGERLFACREGTNRWKSLFVLFAHVSGYFTSMAHAGRPPLETRGGEPYAPPTRGIFLPDREALAEHYQDGRDCFLMAQLAMFAEAVGQDERAAAWTNEGLDLALTTNQPLAFLELSLNTIPQLIIEGRYSEALDVALEAGMISMALDALRRTGGNAMDSDVNVRSILGSKPGVLWQHAEYRAALVGLLPIVLRLATAAISDPEPVRQQAGEVVTQCYQISETAADQRLWTIAAEFIDSIFGRKASADDLNQRSNSPEVLDENVLRCIGYIGATLQQGVSLQDAFFAHLFALSYLYRMFPHPSATFRRIVLPFFTAYWFTKFENQRFRFQSPRTVEADLQAISNVPEIRRAQALLRALAYGLNIDVGMVQQYFGNV